MAKPRAALTAGDHVIITSRDHPWYGSTGVLSARFHSPSVPGLAWIVTLDDVWGQTAVAADEIARTGRARG
jgi:hypothetical protein